MLTKYKQKITSWTLIPSDGGKFELTLDGALIFSKKKEGRFPENTEILELLEKRVAKSA